VSRHLFLHSQIFVAVVTMPTSQLLQLALAKSLARGLVMVHKVSFNIFLNIRRILYLPLLQKSGDMWVSCFFLLFMELFFGGSWSYLSVEEVTLKFYSVLA